MIRSKLGLGASRSVSSKLSGLLVANYSSAAGLASRGLVVGMYSDFTWHESQATSALLHQQHGSEFSRNIIDELRGTGWSGKPGEVRVIHDRSPLLSPAAEGSARQIAVVGLGSRSKQSLPDVLEIIRKAVANGAKSLRDCSVKSIDVDVLADSHAAAEGVTLGLYRYDRLKSGYNGEKAAEVVINPLLEPGQSATEFSDPRKLTWLSGLEYARSQNFARDLATAPANLMTPTLFSESVVAELKSIPNVSVQVHDSQWAELQGMGAFLSVAQGSDQPLRFLEIVYTNAPAQSGYLAWVGKGVTFDSGGISIKPSAGMDLMKGDMSGAASVVAAMRGVAKLQLPINVVCCVPLCENMINGKAIKPGDVFKAMNGKTIEVLNTDAEGRLILADALTYVTRKYKPHTTIDVATLTGAMDVALGGVFSGVFSGSSSLWDMIRNASVFTGDLSWRMPLHSFYGEVMKGTVADLANIGGGRQAGACTAAMFLRDFVEMEGSDESLAPSSDANETALNWAHIDTAGTMETRNSDGHEVKGMTGRPTRMLIEFARQKVLSGL
ncbi:hypothetical protein EV182_002170 [Spiromyces aspiralis]|uniref:Uncharacterized protein n=1 Tax=Spiromyces aspiralis TaxID=68401 RepID=A0ACC1HS54_9FUNG|nr:hypothetical protein EV182_002170 [Spiromyces aspiralis]